MNEMLDVLIKKIFKFLNKTHHDEIKNIILNTNLADVVQLPKSINSISDYVIKYSVQQKEGRQDYIVSKIIKFLKTHNNLDENFKMLDIGGGNGNVLSAINQVIKGKKENFICLESDSWVEEYKFSNKNITYKFWDNCYIDIPDNTCDVIMCMVSLHHMTDDIIDNILTEIHRILKPNGLLLIKEHNMTSISYKLIEWEHHLYHILDCTYNNQKPNANEYLEKSVHNFHNYKYWEHLITDKCKMKLYYRANRFLDDIYNENDPKNPSNLYWDVYIKH